MYFKVKLPPKVLLCLRHAACSKQQAARRYEVQRSAMSGVDAVSTSTDGRWLPSVTQGTIPFVPGRSSS